MRVITNSGHSSPAVNAAESPSAAQTWPPQRREESPDGYVSSATELRAAVASVHDASKPNEETAREWGDRQLRETRRVHAFFGGIIGLLLGLLLINTRLGWGMPWYVVVPILTGCVIFCVRYFSDPRGEHEELFGWLLWPEVMPFGRMRLWMWLVLFASLFVMLLILWGVFVFGLFH